MPRKLIADGIRAELDSINALIHESESFGDPVGKMQYQYRKSILESELSHLQTDRETKASVALFFGGKPVFGSRAINADFAGNLLNDFQGLISRVFANIEVGTLGRRGPVAFNDNSQLMITELAKGSFGFVLEEISDQTNLTETALKLVVDDVARIIEKTASNEQSQFDEVVTELDDRTLVSLRNFFTHLDESEATLRLVEGETEFQLDEDAIHRGRVRTDGTFIEEKIDTLDGVLRLLPDHKKFELKLSSGESIYGSTTKEAADTYVSAFESGNSIADKICKINVSIRTIRPANRPEKIAYRLLGFVR